MDGRIDDGCDWRWLHKRLSKYGREAMESAEKDAKRKKEMVKSH